MFRRHDWVLDMDIKVFFDNIDHELLLKAVRHHTDCRWVLLYVERWLKAPVIKEDGTVVARESNVFIAHLRGVGMLTGNIADFARSVRTFSGQAKALSGNQGRGPPSHR